MIPTAVPVGGRCDTKDSLTRAPPLFLKLERRDPDPEFLESSSTGKQRRADEQEDVATKLAQSRQRMDVVQVTAAKSPCGELGAILHVEGREAQSDGFPNHLYYTNDELPDPFGGIGFCSGKGHSHFSGQGYRDSGWQDIGLKALYEGCAGVGGLYDCPICLMDAGHYIFKPESPPPASSSSTLSTTSPDTSVSSSSPQPCVFHLVQCMWDGGVCGDSILFQNYM
ncbi:unnamed protein product [Cyclocybe aegerita]|uniref:Uncharacterized protein n=1 Tax=Cyclocybe aegerita TaxID=1973307 RepID=A0A8S0VZM6_CYCAE|nr:unnamed protein product [Cyclocybe aegerita]